MARTVGSYPNPKVNHYGEFSSFEEDFRDHYNSSSLRDDYTYEQFQPAYYYGYAMATDSRYKGLGWNAVEKDARREWELSNDGTWEAFEDSVRHAWERTKDSQLS